MSLWETFARLCGLMTLMSAPPALFRVIGLGVGVVVCSVASAQPAVQSFEIFPDLEFSPNFGRGLASQSGLLAVGASVDVSPALGSGRAFLYKAADGELLHALRPSVYSEQGHFGFSVALHGNRMLVGAPLYNLAEGVFGAVFVYDTISGEELDIILPDDPVGTITASVF